jgi:hypothetical protein
MYYSKEEYDKLREKANSVNLVDFLRFKGVELVTKGHEFCTKEHDSLSISYDKNCWRQYSQLDARSGKVLSGDPIAYLQRFMHYTFMEAAKELIDFGYGSYELSQSGQEPKQNYQQLKIESVKPKDPVKLPEQEKGSWKQLFGYLCGNRCLDKDVVQECIKKKMLYLSSGHHNAVFVTYDDKGIPRYATQRGTLSDKSFKCDCGTESDKSYGWLIRGSPKSDIVHVFESPIDALSCATFEKMHGRDWHKNSKLSLGGLWDGALERFLKGNPQIKRISFCTDADGPGKKAAEQYMKKYAARGYKVSRFEPTAGKDINDMLKHEKAPVQRQPSAQMR